MTEIFDLICVGDSTIDTFIKIHDASVEFDINHKETKICFSYGDKIPVDSIGYGVAGNAANVVVGCAKLGLASAIYTNLGDDQNGKRIKRALSENNIATDYIEVNPGKASNLSVVLTYKRERTIFVYHQDWTYKLPKLPPCRFLYFTSIAQSFTDSNIVNEVCRYIDKTGANLVYNPGTYQLKAGVGKFPKLLERCNLLVVNTIEAEKILEADPMENNDIKDILSKLLLLGPKNVVITDGENGSWGSDGINNLKVGIFPAKLVEKTGAGDAYSSGLISAFSYGKDLGEAMVWGTINASQAIQVIGTQNGLLTRKEIERYHGAVPEIAAAGF